MKKITKKTLKKRERRKEKHELKVALDNWKLMVKERDNYTCQVCKQDLKELNNKGKERAKHPHHIIPNTQKKKEYFALRSDLMNGILLCSYCHLNSPNSAHKNSLWFSNWLRDNKPKQYLYCMSILANLDNKEVKRDQNNPLQSSTINENAST